MKNKSILFLAFALISLTAITPDLQSHGGGGGGHGGGGYHGGGYHGGGYHGGHGGYYGGHGGYYGGRGWGYGGAFATGALTGVAVGEIAANSGSNNQDSGEVIMINNPQAQPSQFPESQENYCRKHPNAPDCP